MQTQFNPLNWLKSIGKSDLPSTTRLVLRSMVDFTDHNGICWPRIEDIMEVTGLSNKPVGDHLKAGAEAGFIHILEEKHKVNGVWNKIYQCIMQPEVRSVAGTYQDDFGNVPNTQHNELTSELSTGNVDNYVDNYVDNVSNILGNVPGTQPSDNGSVLGTQREGLGSVLATHREGYEVYEVHTTNPRIKGDLSPPLYSPPTLSTFHAYGLKPLWDGTGFDISRFFNAETMGEIEKVYPGIAPARLAELVFIYNQGRKKFGIPKHPLKAFLGWLEVVKANDFRERLGQKRLYGKKAIKPAGMREEPPQSAVTEDKKRMLETVKKQLGVDDHWKPLETKESTGNEEKYHKKTTN